MNYKEAAIYWIHLPEHTDYHTQGYIGVSKRPRPRMKKHISDCVEGTHYNKHLLHAVNKYDKDSLVQDIILFGEENFCYEVENTLRPSKSIGWNIAPGGHRGPGRPIGSRLSKKSIEKGIQTRKRLQEERDMRIRTDSATTSDKLYIQKLHSIQQNHVLEGRPICKTCNKNFCAINYKRDEIIHYRSGCDECGRKKKKLGPRVPSWQKAGYKRKTTCDSCGFHSIYPSQTVVYHIDGDLKNVKFNNLRTICLNCVEVVKRKEVTWRRGDLTVD